jgi:16S rRNA C967 or C1407 C5-methylase (RsmB/RsmF family)/NOL1/NOP2/fmu family ribosome biogenesis protein
LTLPHSFIQSLQNCNGFDEPAFRHVHESGQQIVSIRVNPAKFDIRHSSFVMNDKVPWSSNGFYLKERPSFTLDPLFHAGAYYVQEASSMFLEQAIRQSCDLTQPLRVLDLCAAPGGKSTLIQSIISEESLLVSNEVIKTRANILAENISKWGAANVVVTNNEPGHFKRLPDFFDLIVVDAPCSGSGLFRKDPEAINEWSLNSVELCSQRQQRILADVMDSLKPAGILIYSTCSYSTEEDEHIADWILEQFAVGGLQLAIEKDWGMVETITNQNKSFGYRFYPDQVKGEGFFIAVFKKEASISASKEIKQKNKPTLLTGAEKKLVNKYVTDPEKYAFIKWQDEVLAFPATIEQSVLLLQSALYFKKAGVKIGTIIRNELIPHHEWALSTLSSNILQKVDVDQETALQYLRRKDIEINSDMKGWAVITYKGLSLGLIKILPGRINNYFPKEWRILNK